ncbi:hypothetical protein DXA36_22325 [Eisenbergiella sp. OF01-20]|nr:hypothetical protein DXA36_22325 [Eisenbergiella sp. OF01-20]
MALVYIITSYQKKQVLFSKNFYSIFCQFFQAGRRTSSAFSEPARTLFAVKTTACCAVSGDSRSV